MFFKGLLEVPARGSFCQSSLPLLLVFVSGSCRLAEVNRALRVGQNLSYNTAAVVTCDSRGTGLKEEHAASMNFGYTKGAVLWCVELLMGKPWDTKGRLCLCGLRAWWLGSVRMALGANYSSTSVPPF